LLQADGDVYDYYQISADSTRVVYRADQDTDEVIELYSVSISGGTVAKLNSEPPEDVDIDVGYQITPDSITVIYIAEQDTINVPELYAVPITGGSPSKLNTPLTSVGSTSDDFLISPNDPVVAYRASQGTIRSFLFELYSVNIDAPYNYNVDNDNAITALDAIYVINRIGDTKNDENAAADVDCNGTIDATDANLVIERIGQRLD
ncbi:MAG: dockerin type I domain-containing protein, partial [Chloroflexota bacterium]